MYRTDVVVIGGGATGAGALRDAAMRGFKALLLERGDFGSGTSGRYHGLLHSGARYAVKDPGTARECIAENLVLRRIAAAAIEDTGGVFVTTPDDDPAYADRFVAACNQSGIPVAELTIHELLQREPRLNPAISRAFTAPDASCEPWALIDGNLRSAREHGSDAWPYQTVTGFDRSNGRIDAVHTLDTRTGETRTVGCDFVVNAAGAWAGQIGRLAGVPIRMAAGKGTMIVMNHRVVHTVINRCHLPADGDIIVPVGTVAIIGTTSMAAPDPDHYDITPEEIDHILQEGDKLVPGLGRMRSLRAYAGVRPLYRGEHEPSTPGRDVSRSYAVLDHKSRDGVDNLISIVGGKLTTYRLMAEHGIDAMCHNMRVDRPSRTADEALPGSQHGVNYSITRRLAAVEASGGDENALLCECEYVLRSQVERMVQERGTHDLSDIRRELRLGMGPCQGGFCTYRAAGVLHDLNHLPPSQTNEALRHFLEERWKGMVPVLWGDDLRQMHLDEEIYLNLLGVGALGESSEAPRPDAP